MIDLDTRIGIYSKDSLRLLLIHTLIRMRQRRISKVNIGRVIRRMVVRGVLDDNFIYATNNLRNDIPAEGVPTLDTKTQLTRWLLIITLSD